VRCTSTCRKMCLAALNVAPFGNMPGAVWMGVDQTSISMPCRSAAAAKLVGASSEAIYATLLHGLFQYFFATVSSLFLRWPCLDTDPVTSIHNHISREDHISKAPLTVWKFSSTSRSHGDLQSSTSCTRVFMLVTRTPFKDSTCIQVNESAQALGSAPFSSTVHLIPPSSTPSEIKKNSIPLQRSTRAL